MNAKEIFEKLVGWATCWSSMGSFNRRPGKPGELVSKLSPEEREELQNLVSKDTQDTSRRLLRYMIGQYPESTVTVHTHSVKKDEENE